MKRLLLISFLIMTSLGAKTYTKDDIMCDALKCEVKHQMKLVEIYDDGNLMETEQMQMTINQYEKLILTIKMSMPICTMVGVYKESDSSQILDIIKKYTNRVNELKNQLKHK